MGEQSGAAAALLVCACAGQAPRWGSWEQGHTQRGWPRAPPGPKAMKEDRAHLPVLGGNGAVLHHL